jgi:hypothetical protein
MVEIVGPSLSELLVLGAPIVGVLGPVLLPFWFVAGLILV